MTTKKKYIIHQTVEINVQYLYECEDGDNPTTSFSDEGAYSTAPIVEIELLDWDRPWDAVEVTEEEAKDYKHFTADGVKEAIEGLTNEFLANATVK